MFLNLEIWFTVALAHWEVATFVRESCDNAALRGGGAGGGRGEENCFVNSLVYFGQIKFIAFLSGNFSL